VIDNEPKVGPLSNEAEFMDLILKNVRLPDATDRITNIGIASGRIAAIEPELSADADIVDVGGRLVSSGFVETHLHLDKSCILDRCVSDRGNLEEAIAEVAKAKAEFSSEDVHARAAKTLEKCILQGTTHIRTHLEVDPGIGLRGLEGVWPLVKEYAWAMDLQICVFPQEGLLNNPGTDELMVKAIRHGCRVVGAAPYTDTNPAGQIDRIFAMAREFDLDIDMHLDLGPTAEHMDLDYVCRRTTEYKYGGRVTIGHVTKAASLSPTAFEAMTKRLAAAGVALTVLPATDLFLMGRNHARDRSPPRGVVPAHELLRGGVNCSLSTNNVLNPFTPFGDCSPIRMANVYANTCYVGNRADMRACFDMLTTRPAQLMRIQDYGVAVGKSADLVVLDAMDPAMAVAELAPVLMAFKRGRKTVTRAPAELHRPS
jgi:cytosine deaminase